MSNNVSKPDARRGKWPINERNTFVVHSVIAFVCVIAFALIAVAVQQRVTSQFDRAVLRDMRRVVGSEERPAGPAWLPTIARDMTSLGGYAVLTMITVFAIVFYRRTNRPRTAWLIGISIVGGFVVSLILKFGFGRPRPHVISHLTTQGLSSFPSAHAMMSCIVYLTLAKRQPRAIGGKAVRVPIAIAAVLLAGIIGLTRVYMGVHYPTDVIAGWCAGIAWLALFAAIEDFIGLDE